jgi:hypothetical protein
MAQLKIKQISDFIAGVQSVNTAAGFVASIDSLETIVASGTGSLVDSVDSLELALSAEIVATNGDVTGINASLDS